MKESADEVLRQIGRNLLLFQQIEGVIKFLVANGNISGPVSALLAQRERRAASIQKQTMGQLIGQSTDDFLSDADKDMEAPEPVQEPWLKITFKIQGDGAFNEQQKIDFANVSAERNELVHHFLSRWNHRLLDSTREVMQYLDQQREKVLPIFERLKSMMNSRRESQPRTQRKRALKRRLNSRRCSWILRGLAPLAHGPLLYSFRKPSILPLDAIPPRRVAISGR